MSILFKKVSVNVIKMSKYQDKKYIVVTQKDLLSWVEARVLAQTMSVTVAKFLWKNIIIQHDVFNRLICDKESENKIWIKDLADLYEIKCVMMSMYNFKTNKMIKYEHKSLINELSKMINENLEK